MAWSQPYCSRKAFILGAIDDDRLLKQVLEQLQDAGTVDSCLSGVSGRTAQEWAEAHVVELWERIRSEVLKASF